MDLFNKAAICKRLRFQELAVNLNKLHAAFDFNRERAQIWINYEAPELQNDKPIFLIFSVFEKKQTLLYQLIDQVFAKNEKIRFKAMDSIKRGFSLDEDDE